VLQGRETVKTGGAIITALFLLPRFCAGEGPFFVTYTHRMEEPRNLEMAIQNVTGSPAGGNRFLGTAVELEYGVTGWWTSGFYLDWQSTRGESAFPTGYRWENRFRLLPREHWINPVLYVEFENLNEADRSLLAVVGRDGAEDLAEPVGEARHEKEREFEAKLILSSYYKGWTISENLIAAKNIRREPYEFGYAAGVSRPLALRARAERCNLCPENIQAGMEVYGGLGTHAAFGLHNTSHYVAPTVAWTLANGTTFKVSPGFGITDTSVRRLWRFSVSYEITQFGRAARQLFRGGRP